MCHCHATPGDNKLYLFQKAVAECQHPKLTSVMDAPTSSHRITSVLLPTMASQQTEERVYKPQDAIEAAFKSTALTGGFGLFVSAVQNTLAKQNVGPLGIFARTGGTVATFGMSLLIACMVVFS